MADRIVDPRETEAVDPALRPRGFEEYVGQEQITRNLRVYIRAAQKRGEPLDHVLLAGPPGLGKTSLALILASEMGVEITITSGPVLERKGDLAAILTALGPGDVLAVAGKGHETGQIIGAQVRPFSDHEAVAAAVARLRLEGKQ